MNSIPESITHLVSERQQPHLLRWWDDLTAPQRDQLLSQLGQVDFDMLQRAWAEHVAAAGQPDAATPRIDRAAVPRSVIRQPLTSVDAHRWQDAAAHGASLLSGNRCGVVTVAGGQGTRLGFDQPKGMFPIGPVSSRTLFQVFAEQIAALRRRHSCRLPWLIMTSDATHEVTVEFFRRHRHFGLGANTIAFFCQASLPALDAATGNLLLADKSSLSLSPDGHGGLVAALHRSGLLQQLLDEGTDLLYYHQVDNPTVKICDPPFIGFHDLYSSAMTTLAVRKKGPDEPMGVLVDVDGHTEIIEYSELTHEQSARTDDNGDWICWAGSTAIHVLDCHFLKRLAEDDRSLPLHIARKRVPYLNDDGILIEPGLDDVPNAIKLERFIFDALPLAPRTLVVEGDRAREFNPVKNADGKDSPGTARAALSRIGREWLAAAGIALPDTQTVEISPLVALGPDELQKALRNNVVSITDLT